MKQIEIYVKADECAKKNNQVIGDKGDYYITLSQLMAIIDFLGEEGL